MKPKQRKAELEREIEGIKKSYRKGGYNKGFDIKLDRNYNLLKAELKGITFAQADDKKRIKENLPYAITYGIKADVSEEEINKVAELLFKFLEEREARKGKMKSKEQELKEELDFLYLYPPAQLWKIEEIEKLGGEEK